MKRFILTTLLAILSLCTFAQRTYSQQRLSIKLSPTYFIGNSVYVDPKTSFIDFRNESSIFNKSDAYGISGIVTIRSKQRYYYSKERGIKLSVLRSSSSQKITYDPTPDYDLSDVYSVTSNFTYLQIPLLYTQASTNHQLFIWELGPVYNLELSQNKSYLGVMFNFGIYNHISERFTYSILASSNYTKFSNSNYRIVNGLQLNLIYRLTAR
jgi:hypothetical protein